MRVDRIENNEKPRVLVLGGGFGGLACIRALRCKNVSIQLLDKENHHLFQPLLYQVATASLAAPNIAQPLRAIFANRPEVTTLMEEAREIDLDECCVVTVGGTRFPYDYLVIALGSQVNYFGNNQWADHAFGLKTLADAHRIRNRVLESFEKAENCKEDPDTRSRLMTVIVIGAGPTGLEMAGALAELCKRMFKKDFRFIKAKETRVVIVDASPQCLSHYDPKSSRNAQRQLESLGVEVLLGKQVVEIRDGEVVLDDRVLQGATIVWAAGVRAHPLVESLGVPKARDGRVKVQADCSLPGYPEVFGVGDIAWHEDGQGNPAPAVAPTAVQMAQHVAAIIDKEIACGAPNSRPSPRPPFRYRNKGNLATIGRSHAVAELGRFRFWGPIAWVLWLFVHIVMLMGMRNRLSVMLQWFYAYIRNKPGARILWRPIAGRESK